MRFLSGMPTRVPSIEYAQLWYGQVSVLPQWPDGSNSRPEARWRQLLRKPFTEPSVWRNTITGCMPIRPVMKSPGSARSSVSSSHRSEEHTYELQSIIRRYQDVLCVK